MTDPERPSQAAGGARTDGHVRFGWWALLAFLTLGIVLEMLHGFKVAWYVSGTNETRRHLWTLAHAHGTLLSVINIVFGLSAPALRWTDRARNLASRALRGAAVLLPGGFFLGGLAFHGGDPGVGVLLVPVGAVLLVAGVLLTARAAGR